MNGICNTAEPSACMLLQGKAGRCQHGVPVRANLHRKFGWVASCERSLLVGNATVVVAVMSTCNFLS
jgi:hypothetical protein